MIVNIILLMMLMTIMMIVNENEDDINENYNEYNNFDDDVVLTSRVPLAGHQTVPSHHC